MKPPRLKREYVGRRAVTLGELRNGRHTIPAGTLVKITHTYRGRFSLDAESCLACGVTMQITDVSAVGFRLLDDDDPAPSRDDLRSMAFMALRFLSAEGTRPITGDAAVGVGHLVHAAGVEPSGQWGGLYQRCPGCEGAHDVTADDVAEGFFRECERENALGEGEGAYGDEGEGDGTTCYTDLDVEHVRVSEGWVMRVLADGGFL